MDPRLLVVLSAGGLIALACAWRTGVTSGGDAPSVPPLLMRTAPRFAAVDATNQMVRLERYLGRHRILVVFQGAASSAALAPVAAEIAQHADALQAADVKVLVVSQQLPQENRESLAGLPFPVLTDLDGSIHRAWGAADRSPSQYFIDRKGEVRWGEDVPAPETSAAAALRKVLK